MKRLQAQLEEEHKLIAEVEAKFEAKQDVRSRSWCCAQARC
jgi:hypothetical protein